MNDDHVTPSRDERARPGSAPMRDEPGIPATPLSPGHFRAYEVARSHLKALAMSTPATSPVDYWEVLQRLDALHDPFARMAAQPVATTSRTEMHTTARAAIEDLAQYGLDDTALAEAVSALDRCWDTDPNHGNTPLLPGGAR